MNGWIICILVCGLALVLAALTYVPMLWIRARSVARLQRMVRGRLVLSYDDGPGPTLTPRVLETLRRHDARASFFLLGRQASRTPELCDRLETEGHDLGSHTQRHANAWRVSPWRAQRDTMDGQRTLRRWLRPGAAFRPPFGKMTLWTWLSLRHRGVPIRWWTHRGGDTESTPPDPRDVAERVVADGGGVVLLHNHDRTGADAEVRHRYVLEVTEALLEAADRHGLEVCTIADLARAA